MSAPFHKRDSVQLSKLGKVASAESKELQKSKIFTVRATQAVQDDITSRVRWEVQCFDLEDWYPACYFEAWICPTCGR